MHPATAPTFAAAGARPPAARPIPLAPILALAWINSLSGGALGIGVFFVADSAYHFTPLKSFGLGTLMGGVYIVSALCVGPLIRRLAARSERVTTRSAFAAVMVYMAAVCLLPFVVRASWTIWVFAALFQVAAGALWPIVESYISGGRTGAALRKATGAFNYLWSSAIAASFWLIAIALKSHPLWVFPGAIVISLASLPVIRLLPPEPPRHLDDAGEPHPPVYERLLACFRWLLAASYVLMYAMGPYMPTRARELGIAAEWAAPVVSAWLISRVGMFLLLERWHGWHGRWRTPVWTTGVMLGGFALALLAASPTWFVAGLALFGVGLGGIYAAAIYYAMAVGASAVEAGGKHEATIGSGMTLGPLLGLLVQLGEGQGLLEPRQVGRDLVLLVVAVTVLGVLAAIWAARRPRGGPAGLARVEPPVGPMHQ